MTDAGGMTTDQALEVARKFGSGGATLASQRAAVVLATKVIGMREAEADVASAWGQHRDNQHIPADLRRALDAFVAQRVR